jgi:hypothetical protein
MKAHGYGVILLIQSALWALALLLSPFPARANNEKSARVTGLVRGPQVR